MDIKMDTPDLRNLRWTIFVLIPILILTITHNENDGRVFFGEVLVISLVLGGLAYRHCRRWFRGGSLWQLSLKALIFSVLLVFFSKTLLLFGVTFFFTHSFDQSFSLLLFYFSRLKDLSDECLSMTINSLAFGSLFVVYITLKQRYDTIELEQREKLKKENAKLKELVPDEDITLIGQVGYGIQKEKREIRVKKLDIFFFQIQSESNYVYYRDPDASSESLENIIENRNLKSLKKELGNQKLFFQIHKNCVVNIRYIKKIGKSNSKTKVYLQNVRDPLPVSRRNVKNLKETYDAFNKNVEELEKKPMNPLRE